MLNTYLHMKNLLTSFEREARGLLKRTLDEMEITVQELNIEMQNSLNVMREERDRKPKWTVMAIGGMALLSLIRFWRCGL